MHVSAFTWITFSVLLVLSKGAEGDSEVCGGNLTQNSEVQEVSSPLHPGQYPDNVDCTWVITAPEMYVIRLTFERFRLEFCYNCSCDYLTVEEPESSVTQKFCGTRKPAAITSQKRALILKFHSDESAALEGFRTTIQFVYDPNCNFNLTENNGEVLSPGYPLPYPHHFDCAWRIEAPVGHTIRLIFKSFELEKETNCNYDYVLLEETEGGDRIGKFCGTAQPPVITSSKNTLILKLHSDAHKNGFGFKLRYEFLPKMPEGTTEETTLLYEETATGSVLHLQTTTTFEKKRKRHIFEPLRTPTTH